MDNDTVTMTAATVSRRPNTAKGSWPERGVAATVVLRSLGSAGQLSWWVADGQRNACAPTSATGSAL